MRLFCFKSVIVLCSFPYGMYYVNFSFQYQSCWIFRIPNIHISIRSFDKFKILFKFILHIFGFPYILQLIKQKNDVHTVIIDALDADGPVLHILQQALLVQEVGPHIVHGVAPALCLVALSSSEDLVKYLHKSILVSEPTRDILRSSAAHNTASSSSQESTLMQKRQVLIRQMLVRWMFLKALL